MSKLVRDKIPDLIMNDLHMAIQLRTAVDDKQFLYFLKEKLNEEVQEFQSATVDCIVCDEKDVDHAMEELADILEVLYTLTRVLGHGPETLMNINTKKRYERGGFKKRYILEQ